MSRPPLNSYRWPLTWQQRFWGHVDRRGPDECWPWLASLDTRGYGSFFKDGPKRAHRVSWEIHHGSLPPRKGHHGVCVCHRCDNRCCVNPAHLFIGTQKANMRDAILKNRFPARRGANNGRAKLSETDVVKIREDQRPRKEIAAAFAIGVTHVDAIRSGRLWKHLNKENSQ